MLSARRFTATGALVLLAAFSAPSVAWAHGTSLHEVDAASAPTANVTATWDEEGGLNVSIATQKFTWVAPKDGTSFVEGEGHAHLLIDGKEVGRSYGPELYLSPDTPGLTAGEHVLQVELAGSDHAMYAVNEEEVSAATKFTVPADFVPTHDHGSSSSASTESGSDSSSMVKNVAWGLGGAAVAIAAMTGLSVIRRKDA